MVGVSRHPSADIGAYRRKEIGKNEAVFDFVHENKVITNSAASSEIGGARIRESTSNSRFSVRSSKKSKIS